ncbi:ABC transporter ATP-binding protein [Paenibacillus tepidiphilus]|uniref:ABC transporter ATP-binding protein n=1 Tax=Paenibacillus tepidiphilus TaxID=2608683 RepID=UPI001238DFE7|nr:ABC transporter ATP-binding protein [Paenibacillus tepidiphilus]
MYIQLNQVQKTYESGGIPFKALNDVSLTIKEGQIAVILGPSGSGKSTLLNVLGGIDRINSGEIMVGQTDINKLTDNQLTVYRRDKVGFIFQFYNLMPNLTSYENIEVASNISKNSLNTDDVLEAVGMKDMKKRFPRELSGGQQQRISIARALVKNPKLLLCDEPTGALDFATSQEIIKLLIEVNQKFNTTILIITHNEAIAGIAHRVIRLRSGEIIEDRSKSEEEILPVERIEW